MRSEYSANLAMQIQPDWRTLLAKREENREVRRAHVAQNAQSFTSVHAFTIILLGSIGSAVARILGVSA